MQPTIDTSRSTDHDEAIGYSDRFSFDEAFDDARRQLPPLDPPHPDLIEYVRVVDMGSESGGIAALNRFYVKVARTVA